MGYRMRYSSLGWGDTNHHFWIAASCSLLFFLWKEDKGFMVNVLSKLFVGSYNIFMFPVSLERFHTES